MHQMQYAFFERKAGNLGVAGANGWQRALPVGWQLDRSSAPFVEHPAQLVVHKPSEQMQFSRFDVVVHLKRDPEFFIWNVMVVLFLITLTTGATFIFDTADFANRMSLLLSLVLTTIGYKLIITNWLPVRPDLSFLDKYVLLNFMFQFTVIFENFCAAKFGCGPIEDGEAKWQNGMFNGTYKQSPLGRECLPEVVKWDTRFAMGMYCLWILWHALLCLYPKSVLQATQSVSSCLSDYLGGLSFAGEQLPGRDWEQVYESKDMLSKDAWLEKSSKDPFGIMIDSNDQLLDLDDRNAKKEA